MIYFQERLTPCIYYYGTISKRIWFSNSPYAKRLDLDRNRALNRI